jgi:hypothetical protein
MIVGYVIVAAFAGIWFGFLWGRAYEVRIRSGR